MKDVTSLLERSIPRAHLALLRAVGESASRLGLPAYVVGGYVRDLLLNVPHADIDLVVEGDAAPLARALAARLGGHVYQHVRFGTAKWQLAPDKSQVGERLSAGEWVSLPDTIDVASARSETYAGPSALPTVARDNLRSDLQRRDFTINTLAVRLDGSHFGELADEFEGERDLRAGRVRVLHAGSFVDDATRMLRAVRLEQRFGFEIDGGTHELIQAALPTVKHVSGERLRRELELSLNEPARAKVLARLHAMGLLAQVHPALGWDAWLQAVFERAASTDPASALAIRPVAQSLKFFGLWFYRLADDDLEAVLDRLKFPKDEATPLSQANALGGRTAEWSVLSKPSQVVATFDGLSESALAIVWLASDDPGARRQVETYLHTWRHASPVATGHRLRELGLPPGPEYGRVLRRLRAAWLDGEVDTAEAEESMLMKLLSRE